MIRRIIFTVLMLTSLSIFAEEVKFTMSAPSIVNLGEQFSLTFMLNSSGEDLRMPEIENFDILMGPSVSSSRSIQIINGRTSQSVNYTYTFILQGKKEGTFTISPASIKADKQILQSNSLKIQVIQGRSTQNQQSSAQQGGNRNQASATPAEVGSRDNLFIRFETDKTNVYKGEAIITTFKLYSRVNLSIADQTLPSFEGFWTQDIELPQAEQTRTQEAVDGIIYQVYTLQKKVLIPQQTGNLTIEPAEMVFNVQQRVRSQSIFDDFFGSVQTVRVSAKSERVRIQVKDLPPAPAGFNGAVGNFNFTSNIDKTDIKANEAITITVKIDGNGNLKHLTPLKFDFPPDFEVYDPKTNYNYKASGAGIVGSTSFEQIVIPRYAGRFTIPAQNFVYFDTNTKSYKTVSTKEFTINVAKGDDDQNTTVVSAMSKKDVKYIGKDIRYIKSETGLKEKHHSFFGSFAFYFSYFIAAIVFIGLMVFRQKRINENSNLALLRNKKASKMARKHLKEASLCVKNNNKEKFYDALLRAFWGYLSDKLNLPMAELNRENAKATLISYNVDANTIEEFIELIDTCEMARYAPTAVHSSIEELYTKGENIISLFEKQIRKKA